jgi:hypothetical protein
VVVKLKIKRDEFCNTYIQKISKNSKQTHTLHLSLFSLLELSYVIQIFIKERILTLSFSVTSKAITGITDSNLTFSVTLSLLKNENKDRNTVLYQLSLSEIIFSQIFFFSESSY